MDCFNNFCRAVTSGILNFDYLGLQTVEHVLRACRTWDSIISLMPKGGETIWGDLDWCPKECNKSEKREHMKKHFVYNSTYKCGDMPKGLHVKEHMKYGGINSFGKAVSELLASLLTTLDSESEVPYYTIYFLRIEAIMYSFFFCRRFRLNIVLLTYHVRMIGLNVIRYTEKASQKLLKERLVKEELILIYTILWLQK